MTKPDFSSMTRSELLAAYNETALVKRKSEFQTKEESVERCEREWARTHPKRARREWGIKINSGNPRRGTQEHKFFERLKACKTYGEFVNSYEDKDKIRARVWFTNWKKKNLVELVP